MELIKFLGGASILIGAIAWLIKSLVSQYLSKDIETFKTKLKFESEHENHLLMQKISLYKEVANPIIDLVVTSQHQGGLTLDDLSKFDKHRLSTTALLAMFAPKDVFKEYNNLIDYVYDSVDGIQEWSFVTFRDKAMVFLSHIRKDIGLQNDFVSYEGTR